MSFRMPERGERFSSSGLGRLTSDEKRIGLDFDIYYAGAMLGLCARERIDEDRYDVEIGREITRTYPKDRAEHAGIIAGMLIEAELSRQSIDPNNSDAIIRTIDAYLSAGDQSRLTEQGHRLLNRYAAAGFRLLEEHYTTFDYEEEFVVAYLTLLDEVCNDHHKEKKDIST